jgi:hypothetical protein
VEKEAVALHLEVVALCLKNQASCIREEKAMADLLVVHQKEAVAAL